MVQSAGSGLHAREGIEEGEAEGVQHLPAKLMYPEMFRRSSCCRLWSGKGCMSKEVGQILLQPQLFKDDKLARSFCPHPTVFKERHWGPHWRPSG